jgi:hypothetical protein
VCAVPEEGWQDLFAERVAAVPIFRHCQALCAGYWCLWTPPYIAIRKLVSGSVYRVLSGQHQSSLLVKF